MTDPKTILDCIDYFEAMPVVQIVNEVHVASPNISAHDIVKFLDAATQAGLLAHTLIRSQSHYRRLTDMERAERERGLTDWELAERESVKSGRQPELL